MCINWQMWRHFEVFLFALGILWLKFLVNLSHIIRIVVLTMKNHQKSAEFWAQSEES